MGVRIYKKFGLNGRLNQAGEGQVYVVVHFSRTIRKSIPTGVFIKPKCWDDQRSVVVRHGQSDVYNMVLDGMVSDIRKAEAQSMVSGKAFTRDSLMGGDKHTGGSKTFNQCFRLYINNKMGIKPLTAKDLRQTLKVLDAFCPNIDLAALNHAWVLAFDAHLHELGYAESTVSKMHKNVKSVINSLVSDGVLDSSPTKHPYHKFRVKKVKGDRGFLYFNEVLRIHSFDTNNEVLNAYKDVFVFLCCTGLRYVDYANIKHHSFDGLNLVITPEKTSTSSGAKVVLPLKDLFNGLPFAILEKYGFELPIYTNQVFNRNLKTIAGMCGISKHITMHVARHTFMTNIAIKTGNVFTVMSLGGLTKMDTALIYVHLAEEYVKRGEMLKGVEW